MNLSQIASQLEQGGDPNGVGFGDASPEQVAMLLKALSAGHKLGSDPTGTSANALKVEALDRNLKSMEFKENALALWRLIPKQDATSTVEQYNRLVSYGNDDGGFFDEGGTPEDSDTEYQRVAEFVKYLGTIRGVTLQAKMTNMSIGSLKQAAIQDGMKYILRKADRSLFNGNSAIVDQEWNGILTQHQNYFSTFDAWYNSPQVIDLRGKAISEANLEDAALVIDSFNGYSDTLIGHTSVVSNFAKRFHNAKFFRPNTPEVSAGEVGQAISRVHNSYSSLAVEKDRFMNDQVARKATENATSAKAPATPVPDVSTPVNAVTDATTKFGDSNGDYYFGVASVNQFGISPIVQLGSGLITIAADKAIDLKFAAGTGAYATKGYVIYMSKKNESASFSTADLFPVMRISAAQLASGFNGAAAGAIRIKNQIMPNTHKAFQLENSPELWAFKQLGTMMKMPLALTSTTERDMILMFGTPMLYLPSKLVVFINAGTDISGSENL